MILSSITPVILTLDEAPNIARTLEALSWASEIVVVDSHSKDETVQIAQRYPNVRVVQRHFDAHACQWNFAIGETGIGSDWILALDADYVVTSELVDELRALQPAAGISGYWTEFRYCIFGRPLRGSVYPPLITLFRKESGSYVQDGHTQRIAVSGGTSRLAAHILHDDRKPVARWIASQSRYTELEVDKLLSAKPGELGLADRIRKLVFVAPFLVFFYSLFVKGTLLDGRAGLYYSIQRTVAELLLSLRLLHRYFEDRTR